MPPLPAGGAAFISEETASAVPLMSKTGYLVDTDHPGPSIPAGGADGLPIGLMLVDERFDEASLYRVAAAYKATGEGRHR